MKIITLNQHCTIERQGEFGWVPGVAYEPIHVVADHIESFFYTGNTNLRMISGDTIKVKESPEEILKLLEAKREQPHG